MSISSIQRKVAGGAVWMSGLMALDRVLGFISTIVLARLLLPEDFGLVAMCTSVVAIFRVFSAFGFDIVLIQRQSAGRSHYDTVWTLRLLFSLAIATAIFVTAGPASDYYRQPEIVLPIQILAANFLLKGFENIAVVDFRKDLQFHREAVFQVAQKLSGFLVTVPLAWYLQSYWALIIGMVGMNIVTLVLSYAMKPYLPRLSLAETEDIFSFSSWMLISNFINVARQRASHFILGRSGTDTLGYFQISQELSTVSSQIVASMNRAIFPGYSKLTEDRVQLARSFRQVIAVAGLIAAPIGIGIAAVAPLVVPVVLGSRWLDAVAPLGILAIHGVFRAVASNASYILFADNRPRLATYLNMFEVAMLIPLLVLLTSAFGIVGAAWSYFIAGAITFPIALQLASSRLGITLASVLLNLFRPVAASLVMYAAVGWLVQAYPQPTLTNLLIAIVAGALIFTVALGALVATMRHGDRVEFMLLRYLWERLSPPTHKRTG